MGARCAIGENRRWKGEIRNFAKALVNATAITLTITNPSGTVVATKTMADVPGVTWESLGVYYYDYTPAAAAVEGTYTALWDVTYSGLHRITRGYFIVTA